MFETHFQRMNRLLAARKIGQPCKAHDMTFGNRCLNCGHTPEDHKVTLCAPRLDKE